MTATINNNTISQNVADTLPILLRMVDPEEFAKYDCMTPTTLDYLAHYEDGVMRMPFQLGYGFGTNADRPVIFMPGTTENITAAATAAVAFKRPFGYRSYNNNVLSYDTGRSAGTAYYHRPRGSWKIMRIYSIDGATQLLRMPLLTDTTVYVQFQVTEPLLLSPFVFGSGLGKPGCYGIQP